MSAHRVTASIDFSYGHRLLGHRGRCRRLHGHNGRLEVEVAAGALDDLGMVVDFADIKRSVGAWVDEHLDHRTVLCERDPLAAALRSAGEEPFLIRENPTAEALAMLAFGAAREMGLAVTEVRLWETPDSVAAYRGGDGGGDRP